MNTTLSIPVLRWVAHRALYWSAELPDGGSYRINEVSGVGRELWLYDTAGQSYLGWFDSLDAAKAAARCHVGDE